MNRKQLTALETQINAHLAALPAGQRPESEVRGQRVQSLAYSASGFFEATTTNGHTEYFTVAQASALAEQFGT